MSLSYYSLPEGPGIYFFLNKKNKVIYVGKAVNLKKRVSSYFVNKKNLGQKTRLLIENTNKVKFIKVNSEIESLLLEASYIKKFSPLFNVRLTDGKSYPLIKITKEKYPKVLIARRKEDKKSVYFGPYPNTGSMRLVLKIVRRIFPFQSVPNHPKRICLYNHLGLCPCPIVFDSKDTEKRYKKSIKHIIDFLNGKILKVVTDLEKERDLLSKNEEFEQAKKIQDKIDAIKKVTSFVRFPFEYEMNPNLKEDLRIKELNDLKYHLENKRIQVADLNRIECYDISNIVGKLATGSLIVFINGEKETSSYRRFKINYNLGPNDYEMMREILQRRLKHKEWQIPSLIVVDGGKGQVSSAKKALDETGLKIPIIGLAKKNEVIITSEMEEIRLPKNSDALNLLMRIRDEAHRFAISYHKKLRIKYLYSL